MNRSRGKFTYSNVVATLALFLALAGGTAFAASEFGKESIGTRALKKEAVTPLKLSKKAKATLTGAKGAIGAQGPKGETGAPGSALAYARIEANGTLDAAHSKNIASAFHPAVNGLYCITPSVPVANVVISTPRVTGDTGTLAQADVVANGDDPNGTCNTPVYVTIRNGAGTPENHSFYVIFN